MVQVVGAPADKDAMSSSNVLLTLTSWEDSFGKTRTYWHHMVASLAKGTIVYY